MIGTNAGVRSQRRIDRDVDDANHRPNNPYQDTRMPVFVKYGGQGHEK